MLPAISPMTFWARATRSDWVPAPRAIFEIEVPTSVVAALTFSADRCSSLAESATLAAVCWM